MNNKLHELNHSRADRPVRRLGNWLSYVLFAGVVGVIGIGFLILNWQSLRPARDVVVTSVLALPGGADYQPKSKVAFQAAGWIEAAPLPIKQSSLVGGLVKEMRVVEGQQVKKGQVLAVLIDDDLKLEVLELTAKRRQIEAKITKEKTELQAALTAIEHHERKIETSRKQLNLLANKRDILFKAGQAVRKLDKEQADLQFMVQKAIIEEVESEKKLLQADVDIRKADIAAAKSELDVIDADIAKAKLDLERTQIKSPIDGIISRLHIYVGRRIAEMPDNPQGALVAEFYQPDHLQVKVDVPLADAARLYAGQKARISVDALPDQYFGGKVSSIVGWVDVNRNTLQAKVEIDNPHQILRPGMLARVQFFSAPSAVGKQKQTGGRLRLMVPESALFERGNDQAKIWVVDRVSKAARQASVTVGSWQKDDWREVKSGLKPGQLIIPRGFDGLQEGEEVRYDTE